MAVGQILPLPKVVQGPRDGSSADVVVVAVVVVDRSELVMELVVELVVEPVVELVVELVVEPVVELVVELVADCVLELRVELSVLLGRVVVSDGVITVVVVFVLPFFVTTMITIIPMTNNTATTNPIMMQRFRFFQPSIFLRVH
uniref:Uncharacterized protein n=1 Tax=Plectus sambesii TaxID=2011161 RepID=A0A914W4D1_9BILA